MHKRKAASKLDCAPHIADKTIGKQCSPLVGTQTQTSASWALWHYSNIWPCQKKRAANSICMFAKVLVRLACHLSPESRRTQTQPTCDSHTVYIDFKNFGSFDLDAHLTFASAKSDLKRVSNRAGTMNCSASFGGGGLQRRGMKPATDQAWSMTAAARAFQTTPECPAQAA